ncbi:MAG: hypothetical protein PHS79_02845 [Patescibacteria group bacterium]|nr:hypothetical protein [Patescibacteria group bacterium]
MPWLILIPYFLLFAFLMAVVVVVFFWESSLILTRAPFIPMPTDVLPNIVKAMDVQSGEMVYDLGCGDGKVLLACQVQASNAKFIGVERSWLPYFIAKYKSRKSASNIELIRKSFFKVDLSKADKIFVYLFPALMNDLLPKLQKELKPGAKVVSCDFTFTKKEPKEVIGLKRDPKLLGQKLFIYEF